MEPNYQSRHDQQAVGLEGLDLTAAQQSEITSSTNDISPNSILQFNHIQFHVASQSHPSKYYAIDLQQLVCDCADFPRIQFCKHIAAIYTRFPYLSPEGINASIVTVDTTSLS